MIIFKVGRDARSRFGSHQRPMAQPNSGPLLRSPGLCNKLSSPFIKKLSNRLLALTKDNGDCN